MKFKRYRADWIGIASVVLLTACNSGGNGQSANMRNSKARPTSGTEVPTRTTASFLVNGYSCVGTLNSPDGSSPAATNNATQKVSAASNDVQHETVLLANNDYQVVFLSNNGNIGLRLRPAGTETAVAEGDATIDSPTLTLSEAAQNAVAQVSCQQTNQIPPLPSATTPDSWNCTGEMTNAADENDVNTVKNVNDIVVSRADNSIYTTLFQNSAYEIVLESNQGQLTLAFEGTACVAPTVISSPTPSASALPATPSNPTIGQTQLDERSNILILNATAPDGSTAWASCNKGA